MAFKIPDSRLGRLGRIVSLSGKVGGNFLARTASKIAGRDAGWAERKTAQQLVATLGQMKGLAQKVGQALSMDLDHVPAEMRDIISSLQSKSEPMDYRVIAKVIEQELGGPPEKLFTTFEREPMAAASLGQVHRATLGDGRKVAVKVQYPGAASALAADLKNIDVLLKAFTGVMGMAGSALKGHGYFDEVSEQLTAETDYVREAHNARTFKALVAKFPDLKVPEVIADRSASRVLTMELLEGEPLAQLLKRVGSTPNALRFRVAANVIAALYGPLLSEGTVHANPHPGNFLVMEGGQLGIVDFGAVKRWTEPLTEGARTIYRSLLEGDPPDPGPVLTRMGFDIGGSLDDVRSILGEFFSLLRGPVATNHFDWATTRLAADFEALARRNVGKLIHVRPPADALMFFRAFAGHGQNLRALGASGDFRSVYADVFERATGETIFGPQRATV